jgi:hypothetical protein
MKNKIFVITFIFIFFSANYCMNDDSAADFGKNLKHHGNGVFIVNEGNFMYGNASLTFYDPEKKEVENDIFYNTNGLPLGDVAQSMTIIDSTAFIVINNSGKIYEMNINTFRYTGKITGLTSPRYFFVISQTKAYISDLYAKEITIVNPKTGLKNGTVNVNNHNPKFYQHSTEQILLFGKYIYVNCHSFDDKILKINSETDRLEDSLTVAKQPQSMVIDKNNNLWVLSDGGFSESPYGQVNAALSEINLNLFSVEKTLTFSDINSTPNSLCINKTGDTLFFIVKNSVSPNISGVYRFSISENQLPEWAFIKAENRFFYAVAIHPENSEIYVSDAKDYSQRGDIYRFSPNGTPIDTFAAGIIPGTFCFKIR